MEFRGTARYELRSVLGAGATGVVFEAWDRELGLSLALKYLLSSSPGELLRFKREFRSLHDLRHENLVSFGELVSEDGQLFFTMELVDGPDLVSHCWHERPTDGHRLPLSTIRTDDATIDGDLRASGALRRMRAPRQIDEDRVRGGFAQLVRGLMALHAAEKVHRDVKPSNVLVSGQGRVVLLDFGLVTDSVHHELEDEKRLVGSIGYMAPEQAARGRAGPESDFYAVGAMLFEVLTQRLPFDDSAPEVLRRKQTEIAPRVRDLAPSAPPALDALCAELLDPVRERRPRAERILELLDSGSAKLALQPNPAAVFVGRQREIEALERALADTLDGNSRVVHIEGESGTGKTTLVRRFLDGIRGRRDALVLNGRCSEREYVPYKAIDGVVDNLAAFLARSPSSSALDALESAAPELVRAFPVLGKVARDDTRATDSDASGGTADPYVRRLALFRAFRDLLVRVCARTTVILSLDDMQWADADSVALISALMKPALPPGLLLLVTGRHVSGSALQRDWGGELLVLSNLPQHESATLARHLLDEARHDGAGQALAQRIAQEADGHPLFIGELVQQAMRDREHFVAPPDLDLALWSRVQALGAPCRVLVEVSAIAGSPLTLRVLATAAARTHGKYASVVSDLLLLRTERLLRFDGTEAMSRVEPYHDRIGAAIRTRLGDDERRSLHRAIATALEGEPDKDPAELSVHWRGCGETESASRYALVAADSAEQTLAFERAARLYQIALDSWPDQPDATRVREKLAEALASAGLGVAAARAYLEASHDADDVRRLDLERRAADQLFRSGHIDEAEPLIERVLSRMGMSIPRSSFWSLVVLLVSRVRLWLTGVDATTRAPTALDGHELATLNACWSVAVGLSMVNNIQGACLQTRHLILALRMGQPLPLLKALAAEAGYVAVTGRRARKRVEKLLARADSLAMELRDPYANGFTSLSKAICRFLMGEWSESRDHAVEAEKVFVTRPAGAMWELASARTFGLWSSFYLGDLAAMRARIDDFIQEAETRGDRYAATLHRTGLVVTAWLASDEPELARRRVIEAETGWSRATFDFQHYLNTLGHCLIDVYEGAPELSYRRITAIWPALSRSLYLRIQNVRVEALYVRGLSAIGAAAQRPSRKLLADAERCASRIARERVGWADALSSLLRAGVDELRGASGFALAHWHGAENAARALDMALTADAARFRALCAGDDSSGAALDALRGELTARGIRQPDRLCALLAPGRPLSTLRLPARV